MTSWPYMVPQQHLTRDEWRLLVNVVRYVRTHERAVFKLFLYERTILDLIVSYMQGLRRAPTMKQVVGELRRKGAHSQWLVDVPLFNLKPPAEAVALGAHAMLVSAEARREATRWGTRFSDV
jgi:hypothetical protein